MSMDGWTKGGLSTQWNIIQPWKRNCRHMLQREPWRHYAKWRKLDTKGPILYDSTYRKSLERSNSERQKIQQWLPGAGRGGWGISVQKMQFRGFPGGTVVENLPADAGDTGSRPGLGRSHMPRSNWAREPQLLSLCVWSLCSATREEATQWEVRAPWWRVDPARRN